MSEEPKKFDIIELLKLISGRVALTVVVGISFLLFTHSVCTILIKNSENMTFDNINSILNMLLLIVSNVVTFYFTKESNKPEK